MTARVEHLVAALPRGNSLDDHAWNRRHRLLLWLLAAHAPALTVVGLAGAVGTGDIVAELAVVGAGVSAGVLAHSRLVRAVCVTLALVASASMLVHFTAGMPEAHFHFFVLLGFIALYQDWRPYLVAVTFVVLGHGVLGALAPGSVFGPGGGQERPWLWAAIHGGFVLAACVAHVLFWKHTEAQQEAAEAYYARLYDGERAVVARLRQAQTVKDELVSVVSHEFRTPLTAIQGFARTLDARMDRMDPDAAHTCAQAIEREAKRLTRMVGNLLAASEEVAPAPGDCCDLADIAAEAVAEVGELMPPAHQRVRLAIAPGTLVGLAPDAAALLLFNLLDNAVKFGVADSAVRVSSRREGDAVVLEITNVGSPIEGQDRERIFDAFVQGDSSDTRRYGGIGLGLHIARRIVRAYGGRIGVHSEGPVVIFRVWLPAHARAAVAAAPVVSSLTG